MTDNQQTNEEKFPGLRVIDESCLRQEDLVPEPPASQETEREYFRMWIS